jgi:hypothetical protein
LSHKEFSMRRSVLSALLAVGACAAVGAPAAVAEQPWGFEQVSPPNKGEGVLVMTGATRVGPGGDSLFYSARSPFAGAPTESGPQLTRYVARREADAWSNRGVDPLLGVPSYITSYATLASSTDLSHVLVASTRALTPGATENGGNIYMRDTRTGALTLVATHPSRELAERGSNPFGAVAFTHVANDGRSALFTTATALPEGGGRSGALYTWTADEGLKAASVLPAGEGGQVTAGYTVGSSEAGTRDPMPDDARALDHVYFAALNDSFANTGLYVRSGDETRAVSVSRLPGAPSTPVPAIADAVSTGGRYLTFHTESLTPLTADTPTTGVTYGSFIYRYDVTDDSLTYIGIGAPYEPVFQMTADGQTVAFQGSAALTPGAVDGQLNFYVWRDGALRLVASPDPASNSANPGSFQHLLSRNGRYFAFTDNSAATAAGVGFDNASPNCKDFFGTPAGCTEVYVFDADANAATGQLSCASCRKDGLPPRGNAGDPKNATSTGFIQTDHHQVQTVADDGTAFFTTPDDLVPEDVNGADDAYAFRGTSVRLVSRGLAGTESRFQDATPDGKTIFFATNDAIVATDFDRSFDMYMTRQGAGFPVPAPVVVPPCSGSDCRDGSGGAAGSSSSPVIGSLTFVGPEGGAVPQEAAGAKLSVSKTVSGSRASLRIAVPGAGTIRVSGSGLQKSTRSVGKAARYSVKLSLTTSARATLKRKRSLTVKAKVTFTPKGGAPASQTVTVTFKQPKAKTSTRWSATGGR